MKKFLALFLAILMIVSCFAGCKEEKETIVVGYTIYAPMNYLDENGKLIGFDTELAEAVFGGLDYNVVFKEIDWKAKYTELDSGSINCIWNGFTANAADDDGIQRSEKVDFSYNYMENLQVIVTKTDSTIASAEDLNGKIADAEIGSAGETYANSFKGIKFKGAIKQTDCLLSVKSGNADFAVIDYQMAKAMVGKGDYAALSINTAYEPESEVYAIGCRKGSDFTAEINKAIEKLSADGTLAALAEKYGLTNDLIPNIGK
jgi:polar amino acid transport system substrate-binding protein